MGFVSLSNAKLKTHHRTVEALQDNKEGKGGFLFLRCYLLMYLLSFGKHVVQLHLLPRWEFMGAAQEGVHDISAAMCYLIAGWQIITMVIVGFNGLDFKDFCVCACSVPSGVGADR